jgi:hypothetical protein
MAKKGADADLQHGENEELDDNEELGSGSDNEGSDGDDRGVKAEGDDQHEDQQDDHGELTEEEREVIRARRREERQRKKQAQREREDSLRREIEAERRRNDELAQRLALIERKSTGSEIAQLDAAIKQAGDAASWYKAQIAAASEAGNHAAVADATEKMYLARQEAERLANIKQAYNRQQNAPQPLDPRVKTYGEQFMQKHKWLDLQGKDADSRIAITLDNALTQEGWNPSTPQYWEELESRMKKYLPHRVVDSAPNQRRESRKSVVTGSGRESSSGSPGGEYRLSPERVAAMKEAGAWDNPEKRKKMIDAYRAYDKSNKQ